MFKVCGSTVPRGYGGIKLRLLTYLSYVTVKGAYVIDNPQYLFMLGRHLGGSANWGGNLQASRKQRRAGVSRRRIREDSTLENPFRSISFRRRTDSEIFFAGRGI